MFVNPTATMVKSLAYSILILAFVRVSFAVEKEHEMCCNSCIANYETSSQLGTACLSGCRLYGMIHLAHDPSVDRSEIAGLCAKSCLAAPAADAVTACSAGCALQERVFREHRVTDLSAKLAVAHGLSQRPEVDSPAPYHSRMFNRVQIPALPAGHPQGPWLLRAVRISVRPLPAGPDGRPRYWVEISEQAIPVMRLAYHPEGQHQPEHGQLSLFQRYHLQAGRLSHRARAGIRWAACTLLLLSLVGLLWLCCSVFPTAPRARVIRLTGVLRKQPPSIQSGDIVSCASGPEDKKPLLETV